MTPRDRTSEVVADRRRIERFGTVAATAAIAASWVVFRPYRGIVHDARLYLQYARFSEFPFFRQLDLVVSNDEQMGRSVYSSMLEWLIGLLGFAGAALAATIAGIVSWVGSVAYLGRVTVGRWWWVLAILAPVFPAHWGPLFSLAEAFAAPRAIAEAAVIAAVALALTKRLGWSIPFLAAAMLLHPLVGIPGAALVAVLACFRWPRLIPIAAVGAVVAIVAVLVDPMDVAGTEAYDPTWLKVIETRASIVLVSEWKSATWVLTVLGFTLVAAGAVQRSSIVVARLCRATMIVGVAGLALSILFAWIWIDPLMVQLQPWRALWIVHLVALVSLVHIGTVAFTTRRRSDIMALVAAIGVTAAAGVQVPPAVFIVMLAVAAPFMFPMPATVIDRLSNVFADRLLVILALGLAVAQLFVGLLRLILVEDPGRVDWVVNSSNLPMWTLGLGTLLVVVVGAIRRGEYPRYAMAAGVVAIVLVGFLGAAAWDQRTQWEQFVEGVDEPVLPVPEESLVLVEDGSIAAVTLLQRPTYLTNYGTAGVAFSWPLAEAYLERSAVASELGIAWASDFEEARVPFEDWPRTTAEDVLAACVHPAGPTHLFLARPAEGVDGVIWTAPVPIRESELDNSAVLDNGFVLYDCGDITAGS